MRALNEYCIRSDGSIREALLALQRTAAGAALVSDDELRLLGILTDGDIRRALLQGATLDSPIAEHYQHGVKTVAPEVSRAEVLDLMQALRIDQIPIVDHTGKLAGLHLLHEALAPEIRPNRALIMAGGRGSRLGDLVKETPKPMLRVAGRPILERLILHFVGFGIRHLYLSVHYLAEVIEEHFGDGSNFGCRIEYLREEVPLGTGGALSLLPNVPAAPLFVCNGDLVTQANLSEMLDAHTESKNRITVATRTYSHQIPFGCLEVDRGRLLGLQEKPTIVRSISAGLYILDPDITVGMAPQFLPITEIIHSAIRQGHRVGAWEIEDDWIDVGQREQLAEARGAN